MLSNASSKYGSRKKRKEQRNEQQAGNIIVVRNRATLGKTELELCTNMHRAVQTYLENEKNMAAIKAEEQRQLLLAQMEAQKLQEEQDKLDGKNIEAADEGAEGGEDEQEDMHEED